MTGYEFAGRWMAEQEAAAHAAVLSGVPLNPQSVTYGALWPPILAKYGVRKRRLGRMTAELKNEGRIRFLDWEARKQVPDENYRITR